MIGMFQEAEYLVQCPKCNSRTIAEPVTRYIDDGDEFTAQPPWDDLYVVVTCKICNEYMLIAHPKDGANSYQFRRQNKRLWPAPDREMSSKIPEPLRLEHGEARSCFRSSAYTATVVMVRRTLEGVCAEHGVNKKPLIAALQQMQADGLIEGRLLEWAEELRVLGNEGAHFTGRRVAREDAQDALALAEALLDYLYVFSAQFAEFKKRRNSRDGSEDAMEAAPGN
jgi:hypothetical protein